MVKSELSACYFKIMHLCVPALDSYCGVASVVPL